MIGLFKRLVYEFQKMARFAYVYFGIPKRLKGVDEDGGGTIVSLTTYGSRLRTSYLAVKSIMLQSSMPDLVVLYLDKSIDCDNVPRRLKRLERYGLLIKFGYDDLKPHKKYYFAMQEYPQADLITIDDDCIYPSDTISSLVNAHAVNPNAIIARRCKKIAFSSNGELLPYQNWQDSHSWESSKLGASLLATGCGGVLYPHSFVASANFDINQIKNTALMADDLYLKIVEIMSGYKTCYVFNSLNHPYQIHRTENVALCHENVDNGRNDQILKELLKINNAHSSVFIDR